MKKIILTKGKYTIVDDEDFEYLNQWKWHIHVNGVRRNDKKFMHQILLGIKEGFITDHIDRNNLNNQKFNLRFVTKKENKINSKVQSNNKVGFKGVAPNSKNRWRAYIYLAGKQIYLGNYLSKENAAKAYNIAATKYFGEYAILNKIYE